MTIKKITPYQIFDSRGEPTLLVMMYSDNGLKASFAAPAGASLGLTEAAEKRDGEGPFAGNGVQGCIGVINTVITPKFIGYPLDEQKDFDELLIALDGSERKENLGANTLLALSGAYLKLSALVSEKPLWQYIAEHNQTSPEFPRLFADIIGGGMHAPGLDIQEYMVVPQANSPSAAISTIYEVYHTIRTVMQNLYGPSATLVGDVGGLAPVGTSSEVILEALSQLNNKMSSKFDIALAAAANTFYKDGMYDIETQSLHASDLLKLYESWNTKFNIYSIEDPFAENDLEGTEIIKSMKGQNKPFLIIGDDFTVTNKAKIEQLQADELFDGIVIKPNQVGTFSETFDAINAARASKAKVIISQRSGETNDSLIADLAYGVGAMGLKLGAPIRGERVAKYNRLLEIEADLDANQKQAGSTNVVTAPMANQKSPVASSYEPVMPSTPSYSSAYVPPATTPAGNTATSQPAPFYNPPASPLNNMNNTSANTAGPTTPPNPAPPAST